MNEELDSIPCQRCKPEDSGCFTCGGYKKVVVKVRDPEGRIYWVMPGVHTTWPGKVWYSFDGVRIVEEPRIVWGG